MPSKQSTPMEKANVIAPPPLIFATALGLGLLAWRVDPRPMLPPTVALWLGVALCVLSFVVAGSALYELRKAGTPVDPSKPTTAIVRTGAYHFSRNPLYVALTMLYLGVAALLNAPWIAVLIVPVLVVMRFGVIGREERYLDRKFGNTYRHYRTEVRRWL